MSTYWEEIQQRICHKCIDGDGKGNCRLPAGETCALKAFLPEIVSTVANVKTDSYDAYLGALRRHVCILCDWQTPDGVCKKRNDLECALDRYYPLVIEIIEHARERMAIPAQNIANG